MSWEEDRAKHQMTRVYDKALARVHTMKVGGYHLSFMKDRKQRLESNGRVMDTFCADLLVFAIDPQINN
jgi:hypothetical protein